MPESKDHLILKYISGTASPDEEQEVIKWMEESPENKKMVEDIQKIWSTPDTHGTLSFDTAAQWRKFDALIDREGRTKERSFQFPTHLLLKVAASAIILMVCSYVLYQKFFSVQTLVKASGDAPIAFTLGDGTKVSLNAHSTFTYTSEFGQKDRTAQLKGEGFFEVTRNTEKPFRILTDQTEVKVLGTSFNVRAYPDEPENEVFVVTGKVSMKLKEKEYQIILSPGMKGIFTKEDNSLAAVVPENSNTTAWKNKRLVFKGTNLEEVAKTLEHYFDITITLKNSDLVRCRFTSSFDDPTLEEVIEALSIALNLHIVQQHKQFVFDGEGC